MQIPLVLIQMYNQLQPEGVQFFHTACDESEPVMHAFGACSLPGDKEILFLTKSSLLGDAGHAGLGKHPCTPHNHKTPNKPIKTQKPQTQHCFRKCCLSCICGMDEISSREDLVRLLHRFVWSHKGRSSTSQMPLTKGEQNCRSATPDFFFFMHPYCYSLTWAKKYIFFFPFLLHCWIFLCMLGSLFF